MKRPGGLMPFAPAPGDQRPAAAPVAVSAVPWAMSTRAKRNGQARSLDRLPSVKVGVGKEAEQRAGQDRTRPGRVCRCANAARPGRVCARKKYDAERVEQCARAAGDQAGWVCQQVPHGAATEPPGDEAEPEHIQEQHQRRSGALRDKVVQPVGFAPPRFAV